MSRKPNPRPPPSPPPIVSRPQRRHSPAAPPASFYPPAFLTCLHHGPRPMGSPRPRLVYSRNRHRTRQRRHRYRRNHVNRRGCSAYPSRTRTHRACPPDLPPPVLRAASSSPAPRGLGRCPPASLTFSPSVRSFQPWRANGPCTVGLAAVSLRKTGCKLFEGRKSHTVGLGKPRPIRRIQGSSRRGGSSRHRRSKRRRCRRRHGRRCCPRPPIRRIPRATSRSSRLSPARSRNWNQGPCAFDPPNFFPSLLICAIAHPPELRSPRATAHAVSPPRPSAPRPSPASR